MPNLIQLLAPLSAVMIVMAAWSSPANAAIHRCKVEDGSTVFQDWPCPVSQPVKQITHSSPQRIPAGMHSSWFSRPAFASGQARCTDLNCQCNAQPYPLTGDRTQAVARALYIDGNWHRYQRLVDEPVDDEDDEYSAAASDPVEHAQRIARAACEVMVAQIILMRDTEIVLRDLRNQLALGRARGHDAGTQCVSGDEPACRYQEDLQRYRTLQADIQALQLPRNP